MAAHGVLGSPIRPVLIDLDSTTVLVVAGAAAALADFALVGNACLNVRLRGVAITNISSRKEVSHTVAIEGLLQAINDMLVLGEGI